MVQCGFGVMETATETAGVDGESRRGGSVRDAVVVGGGGGVAVVVVGGLDGDGVGDGFGLLVEGTIFRLFHKDLISRRSLFVAEEAIQHHQQQQTAIGQTDPQYTAPVQLEFGAGGAVRQCAAFHRLERPATAIMPGRTGVAFGRGRAVEAFRTRHRLMTTLGKAKAIGRAIDGALRTGRTDGGPRAGIRHVQVGAPETGGHDRLGQTDGTGAWIAAFLTLHTFGIQIILGDQLLLRPDASHGQTKQRQPQGQAHNRGRGHDNYQATM